MSSHRPHVLITSILLFLMVSSSFSVSAASESNTSKYSRLNSWEYAWEAPVDNEAPDDNASTGWNRMPASNWQPSEKLLNPEGRNQSDILWFRTKLPPGGQTYDSMKIRVSLLFEVYLDERLIFTHGELPPYGNPVYIGTPTRIVPIPPGSEGKTIYVRTYSYMNDIGMYRAPELSTKSLILLDYIRQESVRFILGCFYVMVGLLALYPYYKLRQLHLFSFAGFSMSFGLYTVIRTTLPLKFWDKPFFWMNIELITLMLTLAFVIAFAGHLFGTGKHQHMKWIYRLHLLFGAAGLLLVLLHAVQADFLLRIYQILILSSMAVAIYRVTRLAMSGDRDARTALSGLVVFSFCGIVDIIRNIGLISTRFPELAYWGALVFLVCLIMIIIRRLVHVLTRLSVTEKLSVAGQLAAGVAHEIRNPITVISGYLQLMKKTEANARVVDIMLGEVNRILFIMNEFLFLAKPAEPKFGNHSLKAIIDDVLELFQAQAESANVEICIQYQEPLPYILCDDNQLKQVFVNVINNALEAMPNGGKLSIDVNMERHAAVVTISDTGCGIPEQLLARIGEPFYTTKENGNGLGVMICRSIIENHDGSFAINSVLDQGTAVSIRLPARGR